MARPQYLEDFEDLKKLSKAIKMVSYTSLHRWIEDNLSHLMGGDMKKMIPRY